MPGRARARRSTGPKWSTYTTEKLLAMRMCDLGLQLEGGPVEPRIAKLHDELAARDLRFRPHCWLSSEWFSPAGIPGIALPFYLAHPRLSRLERHMMLEVEGGSLRECMKILRHEAGHAIDHAYRLSRRRQWRRLFGNPSQPYPDSYRPRPYSRKYVLHIDNWYAQSHPTEDFAETFAVWLTPSSDWRRRYRGWPALRKLEYVDELMREIADIPAPVRSRRRIDPVSQLTMTLREHYDERRARYGSDSSTVYDRDLRRLFGDEGPETAARFLRRARPQLRRLTARWTGEYQYAVDGIIDEMIARCQQLKLRRDRSEEEMFREAAVMLAVQVVHHLQGGRHYLL